VRSAWSFRTSIGRQLGSGALRFLEQGGDSSGPIPAYRKLERESDRPPAAVILAHGPTAAPAPQARPPLRYRSRGQRPFARCNRLQHRHESRRFVRSR